jgi:Ca-activated chloride channel homolog
VASNTTGRGVGVVGAVIIGVVAVAGAAAITGAVASAGWLSDGHQNGAPAPVDQTGTSSGTGTSSDSSCDREVRVVTASSFAPVLTGLQRELAQGDECVRLVLVRADGRSAAAAVAQDSGDVWIPDDVSWEHLAPPDELAPDKSHGAGTVLATSPIFMVTDKGTAGRIGQAGGSWLGLADLLDKDSAARLVVRDPAASGDGMVGAGSVAEAVWIRRGMDASALTLDKIVAKAQKTAADAALPTAAGDVGVVPEYALLPALARQQPAPAVLTGSDYTAELRFGWFPTARAVADPARAAALDRLLAVLTGPRAAAALDAANLRLPGSPTPPTAGRQRVPEITAPPQQVLGGHHVDHVFASWFRDDRRVNVTMVMDISWSMSSRAPGSGSTLIRLVREGSQTVGDMLPDRSRLGLWTFGSQINGQLDYRTVLPTAPLTSEHRRLLASAVGDLKAEHTGTGLFDTTLAAYKAAQGAYTPGMSNQVMVFTDGINEDDPGSISLDGLSRQLQKAQDPRRPVQLSVVLFGNHPEAERLSRALEPVHAYVEQLQTAEQVEAMFIHLASGGLHSAARA